MLSACQGRLAGPVVINSMDKRVEVTVKYETGRVAQIPFDPCSQGPVGHPDEMVESVTYDLSKVDLPYSKNGELNGITYIHVFDNRLLVLPTNECVPKQP